LPAYSVLHDHSLESIVQVLMRIAIYWYTLLEI